MFIISLDFILSQRTQASEVVIPYGVSQQGLGFFGYYHSMYLINAKDCKNFCNRLAEQSFGQYP
jgi:hypothetical protein